MDFHPVMAREVDRFGIDPDHLIINTTNATLISLQRKYCTVEICPLEWGQIMYLPNVGGNVFYLICFLGLLGANLFYGIRCKTWTFMWPMVAGLVLEIIGYIGRLMLHNNPFILNNFLVYLIPLTLGPAFFTAAIYLCLGRIINIVGPGHSRISPKMYTYIFVAFDLLALILQGAGGGIAATAKDRQGSKNGANIMVAGLAWQVVSMSIFMALWGDFILRARKSSRHGFSKSLTMHQDLRKSRNFLLFRWALVIATVLIFIRSVYRVAELQEGFTSDLANDEVAFMILEGPMIVLAVLAMTLWHPGRVMGDFWRLDLGMGAVQLAPLASATELGYHPQQSQTQLPVVSDSDTDGRAWGPVRK